MSVTMTAPAPKTNLKVVFGSMTFGNPGTLAARVHTLPEASAILDRFQKHGHVEVDSARGYGGGSTEEILGKLDWQQRGLVMGTKPYPSKASPNPENRYTLRAADVRRGLKDSLKALKADKIDLLYLHGPDREVPFEETLCEVNKLYNKGLFSRFGISNFMSWEVAAMCQICEQNGWIKPTVYQGIYNAIHRNIEAELFPCLRYYGISLYSFQPLASGFLTSRYRREQTDFEPGSRFDTSTFVGKTTTARYWNDAYFDALDIIRLVVKKHGMTEAECAMRCCRITLS